MQQGTKFWLQIQAIVTILYKVYKNVKECIVKNEAG